MIDPDRDYDPDNPDCPLLGVLKVGSPMRVIGGRIARLDGRAADVGVGPDRA